MASSNAPHLASVSLADDEVEDAHRLANLIAALRSHAKRHGHPEVAAALDPALQAAQTIVNSGRRNRAKPK